LNSAGSDRVTITHAASDQSHCPSLAIENDPLNDRLGDRALRDGGSKIIRSFSVFDVSAQIGTNSMSSHSPSVWISSRPNGFNISFEAADTSDRTFHISR
jgi:hypothetical protein